MSVSKQPSSNESTSMLAMPNVVFLSRTVMFTKTHYHPSLSKHTQHTHTYTHTGSHHLGVCAHLGVRVCPDPHVHLLHLCLLLLLLRRVSRLEQEIKNCLWNCQPLHHCHTSVSYIIIIMCRYYGYYIMLSTCGFW